MQQIDRKVRLPDGRVVPVRVPEDATDQEIASFVRKRWDAGEWGGDRVYYEAMTQSPKAKLPQGDFPTGEGAMGLAGNLAGAVIDPIRAAGHGAAGTSVAGLEAIYDTAFNPDVNLRQSVAERQAAMAAPEPTGGGAWAMDKIGKGVEATLGKGGLDILGLGPEIGQQAYERFAPEPNKGSAVMGATYETLPALLETLAGFASGQHIRGSVKLKFDDGAPTPELDQLLAAYGLEYGALSAEAQAAIPAAVNRRALSIGGKADLDVPSIAGKDIKAGGTQTGLARFEPTRFGGAKIDPIAMEAMDVGLDEGVAQMIKQADPVTRMNMLLLTERHKTATQARGQGVDPYEVIGNSLESRVDFLDQKAKEAGFLLDATLKGRLTGKQVDTTAIDELFHRELAELGIKPKYLDPETGELRFFDPEGKAQLDFETSTIAKDRASQRMIKDATELVANRAVGDAADLHLLKRQLDALIDWNKVAKGGFIPSTGKNFVKGLRWTANDILRTADADYAKANDVLSLVLDAKGELMDSLVKSAQRQIDSGEWAAAGNDLRKLFSNYGKGYEQVAALKKIDDAVAKLQSKSDSTDVIPYTGTGKAGEAKRVDSSNLYALGELMLELDRLIVPHKRGGFAGQTAAGNAELLRELQNKGVVGSTVDYGVDVMKQLGPRPNSSVENTRRLNAYAVLQKLIRSRGNK